MSFFFNRWDAQNASRFFMMCYHEGAMDACEINDSDLCNSFVESHESSPRYGILSQDDMRTAEYTFNLLLMCRKYRMYSFGEKFIKKADTSPMRPFYFMCEYFYIEGVKDYLKYPNYIRMDSFKPVYSSFWEFRRLHQNMDKYDILERVQRFCFELRKKVESCPEDAVLRKLVSPASLDTFSRAFWTLNQPVSSYGFGNKEIKYRMDENIVEEDNEE